MATNEIKYTLNGQLTDNTVTKEDKNDKILTLVPAGSADKQRVISEIMALNSGLERETVEAVINLEQRVIEKLVLSGYRVNMGLYQAVAQFTGVILNKTWDPEKNNVYASFIQGTMMREAIGKTHINIIGEKSAPMYIAGTQDASTRATDTSATAGRNFTVTGSMLKVVGSDPAVGISLTSSTNVVTKIPADMWGVNDPSKLMFIIPAELAKGEYTLKITTQYSGSKTLLKTPKTIEYTIYIGEVPGGGGGKPGDGGGEEENPL